jgi:hypothetical protein
MLHITSTARKLQHDACALWSGPAIGIGLQAWLRDLKLAAETEGALR